MCIRDSYHFDSKEALGYAVVDEVIAPDLRRTWLRPLELSLIHIFDAQHNLVRTFSSNDRSSEDHSSQDQGTGKHQPLPVAERWFSKPEVLEKTAGMHRFVWNLTWRCV